jgi:hypothetical protein
MNESYGGYMELTRAQLLKLINLVRERIDFERSQEKCDPLAKLITRVQIPKALSEGLAKVLIDEGLILSDELRGFEVWQAEERDAPDLYATRSELASVREEGIVIVDDIEMRPIEVKGSREGWVSYTHKDRRAWRVIWLDFASWANLDEPILSVYVLLRPDIYAVGRLTLREAKKQGPIQLTVDLRSFGYIPRKLVVI